MRTLNLALGGTTFGCLSSVSGFTATGGFGVGLILGVAGGFAGCAVLSSGSRFTARAILGWSASLGTIAIAPSPIAATIVPAIPIHRVVVAASSLAGGQGRRDFGLALS
ncbi:MAG: hypothetical protein VX316_05215 [Actinomycetota bacterium]|nr:hypothetical protein [Actinomycetota bacterium]